jgi:hypothetical protein
MPADKTIEYELKILITLYANSQGDAVSAIERRLRTPEGSSGPDPSKDPYAVTLRETNAKRLGAAH